jgi:hypothetical protein
MLNIGAKIGLPLYLIDSLLLFQTCPIMTFQTDRKRKWVPHPRPGVLSSATGGAPPAGAAISHPDGGYGKRDVETSRVALNAAR